MANETRVDRAVTAIGESSTIRLSLVLTIVSLVVAGVWWASSITSKLDTMTTLITDQCAKSSQQEARIRCLEVWREVEKARRKTNTP